MKIIGRGAEAILIKDKDTLLKQRIKKGYRHEKIDTALRTQRTRRESRILEKVARTIHVPKVHKTKEETIEMEFIAGKVLSTHLDSSPAKKQHEIAKKIAQATAKMHDKDIIHNDLTTSNMILKQGKVYFIDFGLSFHSAKIEDKAVDIHLLKEALQSKHFKIASKFFKEFVKWYTKSKQGKEILKRLEVVESRGRYKKKGAL